MQRTCSVLGCPRPHASRSFCMAHYLRWRSSGDPGDALPESGACGQCSALVVRVKPSGPLPTYCSPACKGEAAHARRVASGAYAVDLAKRKAKHVPTSYAASCTHCSRAFDSKRADRKYCSPRCARQAALPCTTPGCTKPSVVANPVRLCSGCYNAANYTPEQRREQRSQVRQCATCGNDYSAQRTGQRYCSLVCRSGGAFKHIWTEDQRRVGREARRLRRALLRGMHSEVFDEREIYERDGWRCQLCRKRVDQKLAWPDPMSPSIDHIIPVSMPGSTHTRANVRLAHLVCNTSRGNRGGAEQLLLFG